MNLRSSSNTLLWLSSGEFLARCSSGTPTYPYRDAVISVNVVAKQWIIRDHISFKFKERVFLRPCSDIHHKLQCAVARSLSLSWYGDSLLSGRSGDRIPVEARFSALIQAGSEGHPTSYTMGTGSFPGVKRPGRGVDYPPHLAPRLNKE
jgi:hypothetical protein